MPERQQFFFQVAMAWNDRGYRFVISQRPEQDVNILCLEHGYIYLAMLTPPLPLGLADFVLKRVSTPEEQRGVRFSSASWTASPQHQSSWWERLRWWLRRWWWQWRYKAPFPAPQGTQLAAVRLLEAHRVLAFLARQHPRRVGALPLSLVPLIVGGPRAQRPRVLRAQIQGAAQPGEVRWREEDCEWLGDLLGGRALLRREVGQALRENVGEVPHFLRRKLSDYGGSEEEGSGEEESRSGAVGTGEKRSSAGGSRALKGRKRYAEVWVPEEVDELLRAMAWRGEVGFCPGVALNEKGEAVCERCGQSSLIEAEPCSWCGRRMCLRCGECEGMGESRQCQPFYTLPLREEQGTRGAAGRGLGGAPSGVGSGLAGVALDAAAGSGLAGVASGRGGGPAGVQLDAGDGHGSGAGLLPDAGNGRGGGMPAAAEDNGESGKAKKRGANGGAAGANGEAGGFLEEEGSFEEVATAGAAVVSAGSGSGSSTSVAAGGAGAGGAAMAANAAAPEAASGKAGAPAGGSPADGPWEMRLHFELTPAQKQAEEEVRAFVAGLRGGEEGLLWAVCGAGKTEVTFRAVAEMLQQGKRVLFAIPRRDVVIELEPRLRRAFPAARVLGLYGGSRGKFGSADIYLATTHQAMRFYQAFDLVILDEADAYPYPESRMLHFAVQRARRPRGKILYLTATPSPELYERARQGKIFLSRIPARHHGFPLPEPELVLERGLSYPQQLMDAGEEGLRKGGREAEGREGSTADEARFGRSRSGSAEREEGRESGARAVGARAAAEEKGRGAGAGAGAMGGAAAGKEVAGREAAAGSSSAVASGSAGAAGKADFAEEAWREAFGLKGYVKWVPPPSLLEAIRQTIEDDEAQLMVFVPGVRIAEWVAGVLRRQALKWKGDFDPWWGERRWVEYAHARDPNRDAKRNAFARGDFPVLVTTTILERGITIPRLNVVVLFADAEKIFDAGSLVQMAGRVGRTEDYPTGRVWFIARRETAAMKLARQMIAEMNAEARQRGYLRV